MEKWQKFIQILFLLTIYILIGCNSKRKIHHLCEQTPKYYKEFKLPEKIIGYNNYEQATKCSKTINKPLAVYFTSTICKNCKPFETDFLNSPEVSEIINKNFVFVQLIIDDKTALPQKDQFTEISPFTGKKRKINNIGQLNCTLLPKYRHSSHPALFITNQKDSILTLITYSSNAKDLIKELKSTIKNK
jgi:thiol:disulfide interchange protein DsbD